MAASSAADRQVGGKVEDAVARSPATDFDSVLESSSSPSLRRSELIGVEEKGPSVVASVGSGGYGAVFAGYD